MANPLITGVTVLYPGGRSYKHPGEAAEIHVDAVDADAHSIEVALTVRDAAGNTTTQAAMVVQGRPAGVLRNHGPGPRGHPGPGAAHPVRRRLMDISVRVTVTDRAGNTAVRDVVVVEQSAMLLGSSNVDNAAELAAYVGRYGPLKLRRSYDQPGDFGGSGIPASWSQTAAAALSGGWSHVYSFKGNIAQVAAGQHDARLAALVASIPAVPGVRYWLILWHEPEGEIKAGQFTAAQFYAAQVRFRDILAAAGRADIAQLVCFAGEQAFNGSLAFDADDLVPPGVGVSFDSYNRYPQAGTVWRELRERFALQVAWAQARGARWAITETGCYEHPDGPHRKVAWTGNGLIWARANGAEFVTYWDQAFGSDPNPTLRRLHSSPDHIALWRSLTEV